MFNLGLTDLNRSQTSDGNRSQNVNLDINIPTRDFKSVEFQDSSGNIHVTDLHATTTKIIRSSGNLFLKDTKTSLAVHAQSGDANLINNVGPVNLVTMAGFG